MVTHGIYKMLENIDDLKSQYPELIEKYENIKDIDKLRNSLYGELIDLFNMETRVQYFMCECTSNFSKTNYTIESLELLVNSKKNSDIKEAINDEFENIIELLEDLKYSITNEDNIIVKLNKLNHIISIIK